MRIVLIWSLVVLLPPCAAVSRGASDDVIDSPMYKAPDLPVPTVETIFQEEAKGLWLKALERPEADLRCKAAEALALAHRRGMKGLETTVAPLLAALDRADQHPTVRLAVARALITMEARDAAPSLFRQARSGSDDLRELVEPALARWDYRPARAVWLARLREPAVPRRALVLAIQGLAAVREGEAAERLREMLLSDRTDGAIRLEAARALGSLRDDGLEEDAWRLADDASPRGTVARLAAASLLSRQRGASAVRLLQGLAEDREPAVAALAVARLLEIDPELLVPGVERLLASPEAKVRSCAVEVLLRRPSAKHIHLLGDRLDDPDPSVRVKARRSLRELAAKKEWHDPVIAEATRVLATQQWRGLEQAVILLTQFEHKPAAGRLVELLPFERPEVYVTAAWGLRRLAVPETVPAVAAYVEAELKRILAVGGAPDPEDNRSRGIDHQLSQLNQFLGQQKYGPADAVLRRFIPFHADNLMPESRAAAIWALGVIHEGKNDPALAVALEERLNATDSKPPEDVRVRRMSALTLGRIRANGALSSLRARCPDQEPSENPVANACGWAIEQITGEAMHPPKTIKRPERDWFLTPHG
jgi:HEAT repeat protein